jgi:hypothetical protein
MFQICVRYQKVQGKNKCYILETIFHVIIRNIKPKLKIFLILLRFKNLWNLINVFTQK